MTGLQTPNAHSPHKWAAVVSGTVWKRWGLSPFGTLETETVRGPLIIWASPKPGEKEDAPALAAPQPTPLDLRVWAVNTAAHFEKFRQAARGKVRASVRWKTGRMVRRARVLAALEQVEYASRIMSYREAECLEERLKLAFMPAVLSEESGDRQLVKRWGRNGSPRHYYREEIAGEIDVIKLFSSPECWYEDTALPELLAFARRTQDRHGLREVLAALTYGRVIGAYQLAHFLRFIEAAAYLAHVRRRVRPVHPADRVPRPVHTRPRPPSAPLAPPVTC